MRVPRFVAAKSIAFRPMPKHPTAREKKNLNPVVQKLDSTIYWVNFYRVDNLIGFPNTSYPLHSDLSDGQRYPPFEQPGIFYRFLLFVINYQPVKVQHGRAFFSLFALRLDDFIFRSYWLIALFCMIRLFSVCVWIVAIMETCMFMPSNVWVNVIKLDYRISGYIPIGFGQHLTLKLGLARKESHPCSLHLERFTFGNCSS